MPERPRGGDREVFAVPKSLPCRARKPISPCLVVVVDKSDKGIDNDDNNNGYDNNSINIDNDDNNH